MKPKEMTQWANAGLNPSPEAMRDHLLIGLLQEGAPIPEDYPQRLSESGISFSGNWFGLAELHVVAVDAYAYIRGLGQIAYSEAHLVVNLLELYRKLFEGMKDIYVFKIQSEIMCLVCGKDQAAAEALLRDTVETMLDGAEHIDGLRLFASLGSVYEGFSGIKYAKREIRQIYEYRLLHGVIRPTLTVEVLSDTDYGSPMPAESHREKSLLQHLKSGTYRDACNMLSELFDTEYLLLANQLIMLKYRCALLQQRLTDCCRSVLEEDITRRVADFAPEQRLLEATSYPEVRAQMEHFLGHLNDMILAARKESGATWIMDVKDHIRSNFADPDLNVNSVAEVFGKNPSYLSRSFLKLTGTSILDYIHYYRIQEAKIRIGRGETLAVAATAVGYSNVLTMSRAFKRYEGTTPGKLKN